MVGDTVRSVLEALKLAPRYFVAIVVMTGALLFLPDRFVETLGLDSFTDSNRHWLGLAFIGSTTLWLIAMFDVARKWHARRRKRSQHHERVIGKLNSLTEDEKQILRYYVAKGTRANMLRIDDGVVQGLVSEGIIYRSTRMGNLLEGFAHNITDAAWDYIHAHPQVLHGSTGYHRTDKRERW